MGDGGPVSIYNPWIAISTERHSALGRLDTTVLPVTAGTTLHSLSQPSGHCSSGQWAGCQPFRLVPVLPHVRVKRFDLLELEVDDSPSGFANLIVL